METLQSQLRQAQETIAEQERIISALAAKTDVQGSLFMKSQLENLLLADLLGELSAKVDTLGEWMMAQALPEAEGGDGDV